MNQSAYSRRWCLVPDTNPHINVNLEEVTTRNETALHIVAGFSTAMPTLAEIWRLLEDALSDYLPSRLR
jgi:hypothetical protein